MLDRVSSISVDAASWAKGRGLSQATLARLNVKSGATFYPDLGRRSEGLFFAYREGWKSRSFPEKSFVAGKGLKLSFWNEDAVLAAAPTTVWITEGELDACALVEAGLPADAVLSVPNGAREKPAGEPGELRGYGYVEEALKAGLARVKRFVWCGDGDGAGLSLRADMAKLLGAARFHFVTWPEGCKDANDVLRSDGADDLRELVTDGALPWPIEGLYRLSELPEPAPMTRWHPGFPEWESKIYLAPRCLSVVIGQPGHGKTALWSQIWYQVVKTYGIGACIASFETRAKPHIRRRLRTLITGALERDAEPDDIRKADAWINENYLFLIHPEQRPTLAWFLDMAEVAVVRHGARIIQLDPWNRLEAARERNESESDYIGRCLRTLHSFAHDMNCHVQIVAHPAKMDGARRGKVPDLEDTSGSKNWENMIDQGFVVHRPKIFEKGNQKTDVGLYHRKARFEELGYPCLLMLDYDLKKGAYRSIDYEQGYGSEAT